MHHSQGLRHVASAAENASTNFPRRLGVAKFAGHVTKATSDCIGQFGAQFQFALLRVLERLHQLFRLTGKELRVVNV